MAGLAVAVLVVVVGSVVAWQQQESDLQAWGLPAADVATAIGAQGFEPYTDPTGVHDAGHAVLDGRAVDVATFEDEQQQAALLDALADSYATHWPLGHAQHFAAGEGWAVLANYDEDTDPDAAYEAQETLLAQVREAIGGRQDTVDGALLDPTGRWEGAVLGDASDYDVVVDLGFDPSSGVDGRVQYPALDCSGTWTLQAGTEDSLTLTEQIDQGLERCEEQSEVLVEQESADDLRITFVGSDITARLRRSAQ